MKERKTIPGLCNDLLAEFDWNFDKVPNEELHGRGFAALLARA